MSDAIERYRKNYTVTTTVKAFKRLQERADRGAPVAQKELQLELDVLDFIEQETYSFLTSQEVPALEQQYLTGYMKRLWAVALRFNSATYSVSRDILTDEYIARGHTDLETDEVRLGLWLIVERAKIFKLTGALVESMLSRVRVTKTNEGAPQSFASGVAAKVLFDTVELDTLSEWDVTNNRFVALEAGYYLIQGLVSWADLSGAGDKYVTLELRKNNVDIAHKERKIVQTTQAVIEGIEIVTLQHLDVGDYVELWAVQVNALAAAWTLHCGYGGRSENMSVMRLTPGAD